MATKKKTGKKQAKLKTTASKKIAPRKKLAKKKAAAKKAEVKTKAGGKKRIGGKVAGARKNMVPARKSVRTKQAKRAKLATKRVDSSLDAAEFARERLETQSDVESGDLQGLSHAESADSESVDELLDEGNAFEAEAVKGVEDAGDADDGGVRTHEVPEDDVPGEYEDEEE
jgi:hypothetical protein